MIVALCWGWLCLAAYVPHFATDPAISPDGETVCFAYQGDLWTVPFAGGMAKRITASEAREYGPCWSPDGSSIAFNANREGQTWVYQMPATGGAAKPVSKESMSVCDWFADSKSLLCTKSTATWGASLFKQSLDGSRPLLIAEIGDYFSSLSPDNKKIIFNRKGEAFREAYTGSTSGDLWEYDIDTKVYTRLTDTDFTERYPRYAPHSNSVFFCASDGKVYQLYRIEQGDYSRRFQITHFDTWSARDINIARQNDRLVYEYFDQLWVYDPTTIGTTVRRLDIEIAEDDWIDYNKQDTVTDSFGKFATSSDDLLVAFSYKYDLFVMPRKGGDVKQLTDTQSGIENIGFLSDNRTIVFGRYNEGIKTLYTTKVDSLSVISPLPWYGAGKFHVEDFYRSECDKWVIAYTDSTGGGRIAVADSMFGNVKPIITDKVTVSGFEISPDGSMAIYTINRSDINIRELYIYEFASNTHRKVMNDDSWISGKAWTPDQKSILMNRAGAIQRLDLIPRNEFEYDVDNWKEILSSSVSQPVPDSTYINASKKQTSKDTKAVSAKLKFGQIDWYQLDKRIFPIVSSPNQLYGVHPIDDSTFYYISAAPGKDKKTTLQKANIYGKNTTEVASLTELDDFQYISNKQLYYRSGSKLRCLNLKTKVKSELSNSFKYTYNTLKLNGQVFDQVWGIFGKSFYDPQMHGRDWAKTYHRFKPYLLYAGSTVVLESIIDEMIGELNASHTGFYPRSEGYSPNKPTAYLGLELEYRATLPTGYRIKRIYPGSSLYQFYGIRDGDVLLEIDGTKLNNHIALDSLLADKTAQKIKLLIQQPGSLVKATVKGLSWSENRSLEQQDKVDRHLRQVNELSANRLGYVYIPSMGVEAYDEFVSDFVRDNLDKAALILDIRGNGGGRIHNDVLEFLTKKPNAFTTDRTYGAVKRVSPIRTWTKPIVLLIDENSFSDAEIFPQLFKEAQLGTIIGMPTSGSVIGTWPISLLDSSSMRMPGIGWFRQDGVNMEGNGAQPDIRIEMTPNELAAENDIQLKKAIEILLEKIK